MDATIRPRRSVLYVPGSKPRALGKAATLPADALILDLEDAVAPAAKAAAREEVAAAVRARAFGRREVLVRVNALATPWGAADIAAIAAAGPDALLLPKVAGPQDIAAAAAHLPADGPALWAMMESPAAILAAPAIAAAPRLAGLVLGTNDLLKDLGGRPRPDRAPLLPALALCLLAARAHGLACIDGVHNAFADAAGLRAECEQARDMGFDGKTLIHPAQIPVANAAFAPAPEELDRARAEIAAHEAALAAGQGVGVVEGRIVEALHVAAARRLLARAAAIAALEGGSG